MKLGVTKWILVALFLGMGAQGVYSDSFPGALPHTSASSAEDFQKALGLSSSQQRQIDQLNQNFQTRLKKQFEALRPIQIQLELAIKAPSPDYKKIRNLLTQMSPKKVDIQVETIRHSKTIESILTPEQREKLKDLLSRSR